MSEQPLTEGARRTLARAAAIAAADGKRVVDPLHLFDALAVDESQATEILANHGWDAQAQWEHYAPLLAAEGAADAAAAPASAAWSDELNAVVREARREAALSGRHAEVGSQHLLWGLSVVESDAAERLRGCGITPESLSSTLREQSGFSELPLEIDEPLFPAQASGGHQPPDSPSRQCHPAARSSMSATTSSSVDTAAGSTELPYTLRILDAAGNRAREGLRVVEDYVRFALDDAQLTGAFKDLRHRLTAALRKISFGTAPGADASGSMALESSRDTEHDVGTRLSHEGERSRRSLLDVVRANLKRSQEALRTLEEYGKLLAPAVGAAFETLRYELYTLEKSVLQPCTGRRQLEDCRLYLLVTEALCRQGIEAVVRGAIAGGVDMVQLREKELSDRELLAQARRVRQWTREAGALFIVNDRPDIALLSDADGVHVGQDELPVKDARRIVGPQRLVGVSTHNIEQARQAVRDGADYLGAGPVFPSQTKEFTDDELTGLEFVRQVASEISVPWFALGGIDARNITEVTAAGATRIAVSAAICGADEPAAAACELAPRLSPATACGSYPG
ncbi:MAG: thiamine phosphate synthase [Planctomycetes bacterium]|nr:thiamine phosphate synthase [Planctomycetota bacterium]